MIAKIVIIHRADIVRKGLISIVKKLCPYEVTELLSPDELISVPAVRNDFCIFFIEAKAFGPELPSTLVNLAKHTKTVGIFNTLEEIKLPATFNHEITLVSPASEIEAILNDCLTGTNAQPDEHEGEELTAREKEVLKLVALGNPNKIIADKLFISVHTVISHRKNITEKLDIKSISGLTVYAILNQLINTSEINTKDLI